jgi:hypothetical protein
VIEGGLLAHDGLHAANSRGELRVFDIQFDIGGELSVVAAWAQIIGTRYGHLAHGGQNRLAPQFPKAGLLAARARDVPPFSGRRGELQQLAERKGSRLMHGRTHRHLDGLQIQTPRLAAAIEDDAQESIYFARDFSVDNFDRFFSWADRGGSSTGRKAQICSLTSRSWPPISRKRWNSATSRWALASAAGEENVSVTVLAPTLRVRR